MLLKPDSQNSCGTPGLVRFLELPCDLVWITCGSGEPGRPGLNRENLQGNKIPDTKKPLDFSRGLTPAKRNN
jgi:hypothetical protein